MGALHSQRCDRVDERFTRATELIDQWMNGNRRYVIAVLGFGANKKATRESKRLLAAIAAKGCLHVDERRRAAVAQLFETIAREHMG